MPTPARPQPGISDFLTRRQLDDLDALMQRMLALPVDPVDEGAAPPEAAPPATSTSPQALPEGQSITEQAASSSFAPGPEADPKQEPGTTLVSAPQAPLVPAPLVVARSPALVVARSPDRGTPPTEGLRIRESFGRLQWLGQETKPQLSAESRLSSYQDASGRAPRSSIDVPPAEWWLRPLLWCDRAFESITLWLGPLGRMLRGFWGRTVLGLAGLSMLVGALAWLAAGRMGWTW